MENKAIWEKLQNINDLPTLPGVYFKVDKLLKDKEASVDNIARIIEIDPAMSSRILRLVNSAFYGLPSKSNSISHSVSVAVLGKQLAERSRLTAPEDAFIAGLLHDIGKTIMLKYFKEDFGKVWQTMQETKCSFADAEQEVASIDHVQIGAYLARKWQLPEHIIEAIAGHHYYITSSQSTGLVECIMLADGRYS